MNKQGKRVDCLQNDYFFQEDIVDKLKKEPITTFQAYLMILHLLRVTCLVRFSDPANFKLLAIENAPFYRHE